MQYCLHTAARLVLALPALLASFGPDAASCRSNPNHLAPGPIYRTGSFSELDRFRRYSFQLLSPRASSRASPRESREPQLKPHS
jgi:hypothetical protein